MLALDGEREVPLGPQDEGAVMLSDAGPWIVDVRDAMRVAVERGVFSRNGTH